MGNFEKFCGDRSLVPSVSRDRLLFLEHLCQVSPMKRSDLTIVSQPRNLLNAIQLLHLKFKIVYESNGSIKAVSLHTSAQFV